MDALVIILAIFFIVVLASHVLGQLADEMKELMKPKHGKEPMNWFD